MSTITTLSEFRDYTKRMLGHPVICVEIANEQLDEVINDAIQEFTRYMYGEGLYEDYLLLTVTSGTSAYSLSGVEDVVDIQLTKVDGINTLFSEEHQLLYSDWVVQGNYPGGPGSGYIDGGQGMMLANFDTTSMYLEEVRNKFNRRYRVDYRQATNELIILPPPTTAGTALLQVYTKHSASNLYNHILVKKLAVARAKKLWGLHLKKYSLTLPGGGTLNGGEIYQDGVTEEQDVMERLRTEGEPSDFFIA